MNTEEHLDEQTPADTKPTRWPECECADPDKGGCACDDDGSSAAEAGAMVDCPCGATHEPLSHGRGWGPTRRDVRWTMRCGSRRVAAVVPYGADAATVGEALAAAAAGAPC